MALPPVDRRQCLWGTPQTASADKRIFRLGVRNQNFQGFFAVYFLVYFWAQIGIFLVFLGSNWYFFGIFSSVRFGRVFVHLFFCRPAPGANLREVFCEQPL